MSYYCRATFTAVAVHHVDDAGGQTDVGQYLAQQVCRHRSQFTRFGYHSIAHRQRRGDFPRQQVEWEIPRCYQTDHTNRLVDDMIGRITHSIGFLLAFA